MFWAASDVGWVVGHSYIVYGPLLHGATTILLRGQAGRHARRRRLLARHRRAQGRRRCSPRRPPSAPSRRRIPTASCIKQYDLSRFRTLFLAGERADPETIKWAERSSRCRSSITGGRPKPAGPICGNPLGLGRAAGQVRLADRCRCRAATCRCSTTTASRCKRGELGALAVKLPLPPGCLPTLWNADERFRASYLADIPGYYKTADAGFIDDDGYVYVMARTDDVINVAGHRLSTGADGGSASPATTTSPNAP